MKEWWKGLPYRHRIVCKCLALAVGVVLLGVLLLTTGEVIRVLTEEELGGSEESSVPREPVYRDLYNAWVLSDDGENVTVYADGREESFAKGRSVSGILGGSRAECLADLHLTDGVITEIRYKTDRFSGKVLSVSADRIEIEGRGSIPIAGSCRGYRLFGTLSSLNLSDIPIGAEVTDFLLEDGAICGFLLAREEQMDTIRVLIHTSQYAQKFHQELTLTADTDYVVRYGAYPDRTEEKFLAGEEITFLPGCGYLRGDRVQIVPEALTGKVILRNVERMEGIGAYAGQMELVDCPEGIAVINVLPLEEYLLSVVPSEMPGSFPEEALMAQAICARTYAYSRMQRAAFAELGAHVDDSVSFQVYNNIEPHPNATRAVRETYGKKLYTPSGEPAETFYYSTSCGLGSDATVWKSAAASALTYLAAREIRPEGAFLTEVPTEESFRRFLVNPDPRDYEAEEGFYRWQYQVERADSELLLARLQEKYHSSPSLVLTGTGKPDEFTSENAPERLGTLTSLEIRKRGAGGVAEELLIVGSEGTYLVISENAIRFVLNDGTTPVTLHNGKERECKTLLPSGFFYIDAKTEGDSITGYTLIGGGYGHGAGMSQNAAKHMANAGMSAEEILEFFYRDCVVR